MINVHDIPVTELHGIGRAKAAAYASLGVHTVGDLLYMFPRAYENRGDIVTLACSREDIKNAVVLTVATEPRISLVKNRMSLLKLRAFDDSAACEITYFNQNYLKDKFHIGDTVRFWGKVEKHGQKYQMSSPVAEPYNEAFPPPSLVPVYRLTDGLSQKIIASHMADALRFCDDIEDCIPQDILEKNDLCSLSQALRAIHAPSDYSSLARAKRRLVFNEMFMFALGTCMSSHASDKLRAYACKKTDLSPMLSMLPYKLTSAQSKAIEDIQNDMSKPTPMGRIIIGDVGCGKTVCAAAAMYNAVKNHRQAALMAPTEILATQHYKELSPLFEKLGIKCELLVGSLTPAQKRRVHMSISSEGDDRADVVIGTQALLSDGVKFSRAGIVITDEQHRFGVGQRALLSERNDHPHVLVMSATPIPRSLALVMYGDLKVSRINEMPAGRQRVDTFLVDESYRARLDAFIQKNVSEGGQVYVVCPSVEEKDNSDDEILLCEIDDINDAPKKKTTAPLKAAVEYAETLSERMKNVRVACVHGRMSSHDKDEVMREFVDGRIDVLVSTTVIEVGVNVPNTCLMIIENAERFGLSQLHQLRGRVGRGSRRSYCVLVAGTASTSELGDTAKQRLETLCRSYDGFEIAEKDLKLRGPGDFISSVTDNAIRQSGDLGFKLADINADADMLAKVFDDARALVGEDSSLSNYPLLAAELSHTFMTRADVIN